jgi:protein SMG6
LLLERLKHAPRSGLHELTHGLLDYQVDFLQFAYVYYTALLEEPSLGVFRSVWLEQLGDLARYRMELAGAVDQRASAVIASPVEEPGHELVHSKVEHLPIDGHPDDKPKSESVEDVASIGEAALGDWDVDEGEVWRRTAMEWYSKGMGEAPGLGRLHFRMAELIRGDEMRVLYHVCRRCVAVPCAMLADLACHPA